MRRIFTDSMTVMLCSNLFYAIPGKLFNSMSSTTTQLNLYLTQQNLSWVRHENDLAHHPIQPPSQNSLTLLAKPDKLNVISLPTFIA